MLEEAQSEIRPERQVEISQVRGWRDVANEGFAHKRVQQVQSVAVRASTVYLGRLAHRGGAWNLLCRGVAKQAGVR